MFVSFFRSGKLRAGGILDLEHYKSYVVNIRPTKWRESLWIGQIDNYADAQFIADLVYYYIGHSSFHLKNVNFKFPPLECSGISLPLTTREMCLKYATSIAKGREFKSERAEFKECVKKLALEEVKSDEVQRVLRQIGDESASALIPAQGVVENNNYDGNDDVQEDHPSSMEVDDQNEQAARLSMVLASHGGPEAVDRNAEGPNALVPGFHMSDPGFTLQSDLTPVDFFLLDTYPGNLEDGDSEDNQGSPTNGKQSRQTLFVWEL